MKKYFFGILVSVLSLQASADIYRLECTQAQNFYNITGAIDTSNHTYSYYESNSRQERTPIPDVGTFVDERCGFISQDKNLLNYEITGSHDWGQDILQLPSDIGAAMNFEANLHTCAYDGDWHTSDNRQLECTLSK